MAETVEELKLKCLEKRMTQLLPSEDTPLGASHEALQGLPSSHRQRNLKCYNKALNELLTAVTNQPQQFGSHHNSLRGSNEDVSEDFACIVSQDSQVLFTDTDVTLPSGLDNSPGSHEMEAERELRRGHQLPDSRRSTSAVLVTVYQEMMTIYEQLRAEQEGQQQRARELHEREMKLKQQEETLGTLARLEEMLHTRILAVEEKHQQELNQLQDLLREKSKENKRLKSSFDTIREQNDIMKTQKHQQELNQLQDLLREKSKENKRLKSSFDTIREQNDIMKTQFNKISEQNKSLENQSKRVQARLENLQRKYEHVFTSRGCHKDGVKNIQVFKPSKPERTTAFEKPSNKSCSSPTSAKLLALLSDWVLDGQAFSSAAGNEVNSVEQCLPAEVVLNERCLKVLPLLADELHHTPSTEPELLLNILRLVHWTLRHMDNNSQHTVLSATLRRIGEEVSKPTAHQPEDPDLHVSCSVTKIRALRTCPSYQSLCPHTRVLSILIILRTVTQADVLALALDDLHAELTSADSQGLFIHYGGVSVLLMVMQARRCSHTPLDILMQLTEPSRYLNSFLEACCCEEFFHTASQLLKNPRLELSSLEKLSILLQKLSSNRKNRRLFELSSIHLQIQELHHKTDHTHTFLCLNLRSILHNLK